MSVLLFLFILLKQAFVNTMKSTNNSNYIISLNEIIDILRQHKTELQNHYGILYLAVFGSCARGEQKPDSDIDILVKLGNKPLGLKYFSLVREIDALFPIQTDIVSQDALKPHYFAAIKKDLRHV
ncbi:nucleotidyltransferase family protein [Thiotrichales bacterium HSG1]|nr:nucleotidyltransferase family protein [Thiotrichales bacterium HSG1]